jgi:hypothetical protein
MARKPLPPYSESHSVESGPGIRAFDVGEGAFPGNFLIVVDSYVCASDNNRNSNFEHTANPQKRRHGNRATSFDLLPMASGESEGNHILLAVAAPIAEFLDPLAKSFEEFGVFYHAATAAATLPETLRAD